MSRTMLSTIGLRLAGALFIVSTFTAAPSMQSAPQPLVPTATPPSDNAVLQWDAALLEAVRRVRFAPMFTARALAIAHTCMYDAWAAYDDRAVGTRFGDTLRRPAGEHTTANKETAISYAAFRALSDLFPSERHSLFEPLMRQMGHDPTRFGSDRYTPSGIGNLTCSAVISYRRGDGANQTGDINRGMPYSDYTGYQPVNGPDRVVDLNRWQPLRNPNGTVQKFAVPQWGLVTPFALRSASQFRPKPPKLYPDPEFGRQAEELRRLSASLTDRDKMIAEYWADGPATSTPPGHWHRIAQWVSRRDRHTLDQDVRLFFVLGNAMLDASIAVWECKVMVDYVRPVTAIRHLYAAQQIEAWAGPHQGTRKIKAEAFQSYIATPPFSEYTSGHSAFSAAGATVLELFTGSPKFGASETFPAGSSFIEPRLTPAADITLSWPTFEAAAREAGYSRLLGGIHFSDANVQSYEMGRQIARLVWQRAQEFVTGRTS